MDTKRCKICHVIKPLEQFPYVKACSDHHAHQCKECLNQRQREKWKNDEEFRKKRCKETSDYNKANREKHAENVKRWRMKNPEKRAALTAKFRLHQIKIRKETISHYSNGENKCACCGESKIEFLVIDHIYGGGGKHRKENKLTGANRLTYWLKKNNYPSGFRVLCHNCNMARGCYGYCPHESPEMTMEAARPKRLIEPLSD